ncbi:alcohol dehydrogenase catalytic domain-containing protein [Thalassolituus pacificus]|uniref:Alcohol dehydrogenase catalytic domain-containing protein n=1 Tax=Thalassolituus pacificus TaxID=2975440 RepID=A0A9X3AFG8_9GAMM|nr:alcohol dehydrogenase catalytic domain-containing protein [Thalassolituus pacificus]MCT7357841.1 alcohol dehydrogenase catalytic domain-containing protein [Thalassolituus pacificus]
MLRINAAAINPVDTNIRDGDFKLLLPYRTPFILGHDLSGTVLRIGADVHKFKAGDEVFGRPRDYRIGTFAEFIAVDQDDLALKPAGLDMEQAALIALTARQALVDVGKVKPGQKVLIPAGSGGVGIIQASGGYGRYDHQCKEF